MEGCNFKIGDLVAKKRDVELWAAGENSSPLASEVSIIVESGNGFTVTNGRNSGMKTSEVILESEAKTHALKFLADRMAIIAGV